MSAQQTHMSAQQTHVSAQQTHVSAPAGNIGIRAHTQVRPYIGVICSSGCLPKRPASISQPT